MTIEAQETFTDTTIQDEPTERMYFFPPIGPYVVAGAEVVAEVIEEKLDFQGDAVVWLAYPLEQWQRPEAEPELWRDVFLPTYNPVLFPESVEIQTADLPRLWQHVRLIKPEQHADALPAEADFPEYDTDTQSAFDILHDIEKQERQQILEEIRQLPLPISGRVSARLQALIENAEDEYPEEELLPVPSMWDVMKFLRSDHAWTYPDIVVSVRGNIVLDWLHDTRHHLTIEFLGHGQTKLVLLAPDIVWKHRPSVVASTQSVESIPALLKAYDALSWVTQ